MFTYAKYLLPRKNVYPQTTKRCTLPQLRIPITITICKKINGLSQARKRIQPGSVAARTCLRLHLTCSQRDRRISVIHTYKFWGRISSCNATRRYERESRVACARGAHYVFFPLSQNHENENIHIEEEEKTTKPSGKDTFSHFEISPGLRADLTQLWSRRHLCHTHTDYESHRVVFGLPVKQFSSVIYF